MRPCYECGEPLGVLGMDCRWTRVQKVIDGCKQMVKDIKVEVYRSNTDNRVVELSHFDCTPGRVERMWENKYGMGDI